MANAETFATVLRIVEQAYLRMQLRELVDDGSGAVGGTVVDYQDLSMPIPLVNTAQNLS
jgi:hypothetical protein